MATSPSQPPSLDSNITQTIVAVVFGIAATIIGVVTVYQAHRSWNMWREDRNLRQQQQQQEQHGQSDMALQDLESGTIDGRGSPVASNNEVTAGQDDLRPSPQPPSPSPPPPYVSHAEYTAWPAQETAPGNDA